MSERLTPNSILNSICPGLIVEKPKPDPGLVNEIVTNLPIKDNLDQIVGSGDWSRARSSGGSVVLGSEEASYVVKVDLGTSEKNPLQQAREMMISIAHFGNVSPKTFVVIVKADGGIPKPVIIQKRSNGVALCHAPVKRLFKTELLEDVKEIVLTMREWYRFHNSYDTFGQKLDGVLGRLIQYFPFLTDNIFSHEDGAILVDNILYPRPKPDDLMDKLKWLVKECLFRVQLGTIDGLLLATKARNFLEIRNKVDLLREHPVN